jgi:hypothetical protein
MNEKRENSKKPHWFTGYQEEIIKNIKLREKTEKKELKLEKYALKILNKLPEELVKLCFEFLDNNLKKKNHLTKITYLLKEYVGSVENLTSDEYENYPVYKLLTNIPDKVLLKFIKCGTPSRYYQKIMNNKLFYNYKEKHSFYKTLVERYPKCNILNFNICAWEITKLVRFSFKEIMIEGEELYNTDYKKYKEYELHFKKYEKYIIRLLNSIIYLHNKYINPNEEKQIK